MRMNGITFAIVVVLMVCAVARAEPPYATIMSQPMCRNTSSVVYVPDTTEVSPIDDDNEDVDADEQNIDPYRGRSNWSPEDFGRLADSVGMDNRKGQSAAIANILTNMKQGNIEGARKRLRSVLATPGYMLDPELAQVLVALDVVLGNPKFSVDNANIRPADRDTVYLVDTVYRESPSDRQTAEPERAAEPRFEEQAPPTPELVHDTVYVDVVKYDTVYVDQGTEPGDESQTDTVATDDVPTERGTTSGQSIQPNAEAKGRMAMMEAEIERLKTELQHVISVAVPKEVTRQCFTILVTSYSDRARAESRVRRLQRLYSRTRLAISESESAPFSVIIGYYKTMSSARAGARRVSRVIGRTCRAAATTIAERVENDE